VIRLVYLGRTLLKIFSSFLEVPNATDPELGNKMEWQCIYALLEVIPEENLVKKDNYFRFLSFFSPVRVGYNKEGNLWLNEIKLLLSQKWFHGPIDSRVAGNRISAQESAHRSAHSFLSTSNGGLLVRFSNLERTYTLTYKKPHERDCKNIRLDKTHYQDIPSLIAFVESLLKKKKIDATSYERMYQPIFENKPKPTKPNTGTYTITSELFDKIK